MLLLLLPPNTPQKKKFLDKMLNKNNSENKGLIAPPLISPRISFSTGFLDSPSLSSSSSSHNNNSHSQMIKRAAAYRDAPVSSDFEFSVGNFSKISSADELVFNGKLLPFKGKTTTTLKDELENEEDDDEFCSRPPKNPTRLRGFLGLRKSHIGSKNKSVVNADSQKFIG